MGQGLEPLLVVLMVAVVVGNLLGQCRARGRQQAKAAPERREQGASRERSQRICPPMHSTLSGES
jgi:hypothetical protein